METIKLELVGFEWWATFSSPEIYKLFNTNRIPTAFTIGSSAQKVQAEVQRLNPDCLVEVV